MIGANIAKLLELWKDADPGIAEVGDAKKRLAGLGRHQFWPRPLYNFHIEKNLLVTLFQSLMLCC